MTSILNVFTSLKNEFEEARKGLKNVEENIKKLTGREPGIGKKATKRSSTLNDSNDIEEGEIINDEPPNKTKSFDSSFARIKSINRQREIRMESEEREDSPKRHVLQSQVIATQREIKPRHQVIEEQSSDKKSMARNRRMFGMILGTLQKFQSEESRRKETTQRRVEIEKKLEKAAEEEKASLKKERKELYKVRREKQAEIRRIELKLERAEIHQEWEKSQKFLAGFIQTKTKPYIFYMPVKPSSQSEKRLKETKDKYRMILAEKRAKVQKELSDIDELYKKDEALEEDGEGDHDMVEIKENEGPKEDNKDMEIDDNKGNIIDETGEVDNSKDGNRINDSNMDLKNECNQGSKDSTTSDAFAEKEFEPIYDE